MSKNLLRVGLLLDSLSVPAWVHHAVQHLSDDPLIDLALVVVNRDAAGKAKRLFPGKPRGGGFLFDSYIRFDRRKYPPRPDALALEDLSGFFPGGGRIDTEANEKGELPASDVETIRQQNLDVLVRFGFTSLAGDVFGSARAGVWQLEFGTGNHRHRVPAGFWEVLRRKPMTSVSVVSRNGGDEDAGKTVEESRISTAEFSVHQNWTAAYWRGAMLLLRALRGLRHTGGAEDETGQGAAPDHQAGGQVAAVPRITTANLAFPLAFHIARMARRKAEGKFFFEQWSVLFQFSDQPTTDFRNFRRMMPPKDRFWADPFIWERDGRYYLFVEEATMRPKKGHISVIEMDSDGNYGESIRLIEHPYHMSYPLVLEWEGGLYMIPESAQSGTIQLYGCVRFPDRWELVKNLREDVYAVDTTPFFHGDRWWFFLNMIEHPGASSSDELFLFHADSPISSDWHPHPLNPIISDVSRARPAGMVFRREDGKLIRPSQDCSKRYGYGLKFNEIVTLDTERYEEKRVAFFEPDWKSSLLAIHTYNRTGRLSVIDGKYRRRK